MRLDWHTQFLTSHGFAVAEIDYRGSTGYGRAYRNALRAKWGEQDAHDCIDGVEYLTTAGAADPLLVAIWGASAGGYTALWSAILSSAFNGAIARSPIVNPVAWQQTGPKFQAHHANMLLGPRKNPKSNCHGKSILENSNSIEVPLLLIQGEQDRISPVSQSRALADAMGGLVQLVVLRGQGHTLHAPQIQEQVLEMELDFLKSVRPRRRAGGTGQQWR
jgi:dipeptidyl aminopeptidase/acylaminoacyl peptidase